MSNITYNYDIDTSADLIYVCLDNFDCIPQRERFSQFLI